jgi:hypothetical protein
MSKTDDDILDDLFHGCAISAFVELAIKEGGPPDQEATRQLAYRLYEDALAAKNSTASKRLTDECQSLTSPENCATVDP